ncbi:hypothetical protein ABZ565_21960, partial [Streptomyces sp. NPDC016469]|uniref:hypothetical protein n=1 Tax=Streptomyces sp. NPDC016469 TaxID=3157191 RepID=UPI0033E4C574
SIRLFRVRFPVEAGQAVFAFQFFAFAFPFPAAPTLSEVLSRNFHPVSKASGARVRSLLPGEVET